MELLEYSIEDSTIAEILGVQNFTNEESAILELVKNAYDAMASNITICIDKKKITITDNGCGMDHDKFISAWMHIGKSDKEYILSIDDEKRVLAGSKGVGRFAIARLGKKALLYSKMVKNRAIEWRTDWNRSSLEYSDTYKEKGTSIVIEELRDNWTESRVNNLCDFLSRTINDDKMEIIVEYMQNRRRIRRYFDEAKLGVNCVSIIRLRYMAEQTLLYCDIESDEFRDEVVKICPDVDINRFGVCIPIADELVRVKQELSDSITDTEWLDMLKKVGDFYTELYFSLTSLSQNDYEKYCYKHKILSERFEYGVILYRNAFSISSYEGKKDWLELGKRSRKSPAAASHQTGAWRVRENQLSGKVIIDKKKNRHLMDMMNRQGFVENDTYRLFTSIIIVGLNCFERYRQKIIRSIAKKNEYETVRPILMDRVIKDPEKIRNLSSEDSQNLVFEIERIRDENKENRKVISENEKKYRYDIRLLNSLATSGLKATSIAHEVNNDRNSIDENVDYIVAALKRYDVWELINDEENRQYINRDIPALLQKNKRLNKKIVAFMDVLLSESEIKEFIPETIDIDAFFGYIKKIWERDYTWIDIKLDIKEGLEFVTARDILNVIIDNLLLNSIQQNDSKNELGITISVKKGNGLLHFKYSDNGVGLAPKYLHDPMRILEVHETTRKNGHGIGMWMVNNTVMNSGGEIENISGNSGFSIEFTIGGKT